MNITDLSIEVTRECNMNCDHCLRGEQQVMNLSTNYISDLLDQLSYISDVTFTGGEPSLVPGIIKCFLEMAKERNIEIGSFYIATNGTNADSSFINTCLDLFAYCKDKELCYLQYSNDIYHDTPYYIVENIEKLKGLKFFSFKYKNERLSFNGMLDQGRAVENCYISNEVKEYPIKSIEDFNDSSIYLNCLGQIINGCDWSYINQEKHVICNVKDLTSFYYSLPKE